MPSHANIDWNLPAGNPTHVWESIHAAILMDIRRELQTLNCLLGCRNFTQVPAVLRAIKRNTTKRKYVRKV